MGETEALMSYIEQAKKGEFTSDVIDEVNGFLPIAISNEILQKGNEITEPDINNYMKYICEY